MLIRFPFFIMRNISQSSDVPCDTNTITVSNPGLSTLSPCPFNPFTLHTIPQPLNPSTRRPTPFALHPDP